MTRALSEAAAGGADLSLVEGTLEVSRLQRSVDVARQGLALSATGAYVLVDVPGSDPSSAEQSLISKAQSAASGGSSLSSYTGVAHSVSGGLALSTPRTKVALSASHTIPNPASDTYPTSLVGLTASQTVYDGYPGGQFKGTLEKSRLTFQGKELAASQARSAAVAKAKTAYVAMLAAQRDLVIKKQVLEKLTVLLSQIEAVFALKQVSSIDLRTAQINARTAEIDVAAADKVLRMANERLAVVMGRRADARFSVADIEEPALPASSIDEAIRIAMERRTDLAQYGLSASSSRIDAALARAQSRASVSVTGGAGVAIGHTSPVDEQFALSIGAKVSMPLIDSGSAKAQARASEAQAALNEAQAATLKRSLASDIRDYYETAQLAAERVALARESADLAAAHFELVKAQNQYGTATTQDVLTASTTAATAEVAYGTARNAYLLAELSLETAMGL
jgi:outer membrane protein